MQDRIRDVEQALRYSTPYVQHLRERGVTTRYLDDLHAAIRSLIADLGQIDDRLDLSR